MNTSTFLVGLAELVGVMDCATFRGDEFFELQQLGVGFRRHILRGVVKDAELILVLLQILQPVSALIQFKVFEAILEFAADEQRLFKLLVLSGIVDVQLAFVGFRILVWCRDEIADLFFQELSILPMVRPIVISNDFTELSSRLRKFTFIMPTRKRSRSAWLKGSPAWVL